MRWPLAPAGALLLVALLATWNLSAYPRSYYDEGINLHAARNLAHSGRYGLVYSRELRPFDVQLTTGPTVIAPAAVAFKAFGIGLAQGRAVMAAYLLLAAGGLFWVGTQLYGRTVGTVALLVLAASDNATPAEARFVVGEAAALAFILWGAALFASARAAGRVSGHLGAGLLFGLAILTKAQFGLLPLLLVALWLITRGRPGGFALRHLLLLLVALATPLALWQLYQLSALGPAGYAELIGQTRDVARVSSTVPPLRRTPEAMIYLLSAFPATLAVVGLAYVWLLLTRQDWRSQPAEHLLLPGLALVTLVWYAGLSMGWTRLITPTVAIASLFVAKLFCDLGRAAGVRRAPGGGSTGAGSPPTPRRPASCCSSRRRSPTASPSTASRSPAWAIPGPRRWGLGSGGTPRPMPSSSPTSGSWTSSRTGPSITPRRRWWSMRSGPSSYAGRRAWCAPTRRRPLRRTWWTGRSRSSSGSTSMSWGGGPSSSSPPWATTTSTAVQALPVRPPSLRGRR